MNPEAEQALDELKACPFCGSSNTTLDYYEISCPQELGTIVICNDCGASAKSIVEWNTRPIEDALNARIAELEEAQRWIPVGERLPQIYDDCEGEKSDCCYVRDIHKCVWIAYYRPDEKDWYGLPTGIILTAVTHWMPLPQPPEDK